MPSEDILLRNNRDIVGFGRYVLHLETKEPSTQIHGHDLRQFAKAGQHLVAIHSVQIFVEFEEQPYPYAFKGFDDPPVLLGDLNHLEKAFKQVIAWDNHKIATNPRPALTKIGAIPRQISAEILNAVRDVIVRSPVKGRFTRNSTTSTDEIRPAKRQKTSKLVYQSIYQQVNRACSENRSVDIGILPDAYEVTDDDEEYKEKVRENNKTFCGDAMGKKTIPDGTESPLPKPSEGSVNQSPSFLSQENSEKVLSQIDSGKFDESIDQFDEETKAIEENNKQIWPRARPKIRSVRPRTRVTDEIQRNTPEFRSMGEKSILCLQENEPGNEAADRLDNFPNNCETPLSSAEDTPDNSDRFEHVTKSSTERIASAHQSDAALQLSNANIAIYDSAPYEATPSARYVATASQFPGARSKRVQTDVDSVPLNSMPRDLLSSAASAVGGHMPLALSQQNVGDMTVSVPIKPRQYRFKTREKAQPKQTSQRTSKRLDLHQQSLVTNPFVVPRPCCNGGCFFVIDPEYAVVQYRRFLKMDRQSRKRALKSMYIRNSRAFWFGGAYVCTRFLSKGLGFSNQLQCAVKGTPKARASSSVKALPRRNTRETKKNQIILFLRDLSDRVGDRLPTRPHSNLPLLSKKQVFERYLRDTNDFRDDDEHPSLSYWCYIWKQSCSDIKTHRHHGFTVCDCCERIRSGFETAENEQEEVMLRREMGIHYSFVEGERRDYERRKDLSKKFRDKYLSLIVDGADQKSFGLPHFVFSTKEDKGHKLKVKIVGVLTHGPEKELSLFTLTEEFETGANHIIEALHRVLERTKANRRKLPPVLLIQADNCTRENKNRFFLSYLDLLVRKGVFEEVQLSFLPIGHTHADIDQAFSAVATRFRLERAVTDRDVLELLKNAYNPRAHAESMLKVANFSGLCSTTKCLTSMNGFSHFRFFRITRKVPTSRTTDEGRNEFVTTCDVKIQAYDEWSALDNSSERRSFLKFAPDLTNTPATDTTPPDNVLEVNKHLRSCEHRIQSAEKLRILEALRDRVYTRRKEPFHWNLANCVEETGNYRIDRAGENGGEGYSNERISGTNNGGGRAEPLMANLTYSLNFFIAVKTSQECTDPFWIARTSLYDVNIR